MLISKVSLVKAATLLVALSTALVGGRCQNMTVNPTTDQRIALSALGSESSLLAKLDVTPAMLPKTALRLQNRTSKAMTAIVFRWDYVDSSGNRRMTYSHLDGYLFPPIRIQVPAGDEAIASELGICQSSRYAELAQNPHQFGSPLGWSGLNSIFSDSSSVTVTLDLVILEDGELIGPDKSHYEEEIADRHKAMLALVDQMNGAIGDADIESRINSFISLSKTRFDHQGQIQQSLARTLSRSPNRLGTIASFRTHTIPVKFYRSSN